MKKLIELLFSPKTLTERSICLKRMGVARPLGFLCTFLVLASGLLAEDRVINVDSLEALRKHLNENGVNVRLRPGTYRLDTATDPNFLEFSGSDTHFDFTGVKLEVDTTLLKQFKNGVNMLYLSGDRVVLQGLELETIGTNFAPGGCRAISIIGDSVTLSNVSLKIAGSYPYGYGSFFGIGAGAKISPKKMNGIRVGGLNAQVIACRVITRGMGHAIFIRGGQNVLIKDCYVEGALRKTDDILAEKSGPAFDLGFIQSTGEPIPAGQMTSLSEDGIRCYPTDPSNGNRRTQDIRVENCKVVRMRKGVAICRAAGTNVVEGCEVTEIERVGYHIGSNTKVRNCRADALYSQRGVLDIDPQYEGSDVEIEVLDSRAHYGNTLLAKISGKNHRVVLKEALPGAVPSDLSIELGTHNGSEDGESVGTSIARRIRLVNATTASVLLEQPSFSCMVESLGTIINRGTDNQVQKQASKDAKGSTDKQSR